MAEKYVSLRGGGPVRRLQTDVDIAAPIEKVWDAISDVEHVQHWWTGGRIDEEEGGRYTLEGGEEVNGTIKVKMRPYIFEFTWNDRPSEAKASEWIDHNTKSLVRIDLVELDATNTHLTLIQFNPAANSPGAAAGWHYIAGERLKLYVETGSVERAVDTFEELKQMYTDA